MSIGWQYQREHLDPLQRSHHVIKNGGDQPNVVPSKASIWFYIRNVTYPKIMEMYERANQIAEGAAMMTQTKMTRKVLAQRLAQGISTKLLLKQLTLISVKLAYLSGVKRTKSLLKRFRKKLEGLMLMASPPSWILFVCQWSGR